MPETSRMVAEAPAEAMPYPNGERPHQHTIGDKLRSDAFRISHQHPHRGAHTHRRIGGDKPWIPILDLQPVYAAAA